MSDTIYLTGEAKAPSNNPITSQFGLFYVAFEIEPDTHRILDVDCTATLALTRNFIRSLFVDADDLITAYQAVVADISQPAAP